MDMVMNVEMEMEIGDRRPAGMIDLLAHHREGPIISYSLSPGSTVKQ